MSSIYLHEHKDFKDLLSIDSEKRGVDPFLTEKDYWIMHCLYGLQLLGLQFELKGGTSLSKAYQVIDRFSEDIDIHIHPNPKLGINENPKNNNPNNIQRRLKFYNDLTDQIRITGITEVQRDTTFDDLKQYRSGGIRLFYPSLFHTLPGVKEGILLEVGFDMVSPNDPIDISSWAYDRASQISVDIIDNRAKRVPCYHMGYTFVEKLQTIVTKFRIMSSSSDIQVNFMRQYYDIYHLLKQPSVLDFIGTKEYEEHKERRFPKTDYEIPIHLNQAFLLEDITIKATLNKLYKSSAGLYYNGQPDFEMMLGYIAKFLNKL